MTKPALQQNSSNDPDYEAIKTKQKSVWGAGDYGRIGVTLQISGELLAEAMDLRAGQNVLDVAAGNGNASLAAARRFCDVTSTDYVEELLEKSEKRAQADGFSITYQEADAENLPFKDESFDNVISTFGAMFAPNQEKVAQELLRVCKKEGKIGMANWTPSSFIGRLFSLVGQFVPPAPGVFSPARWGDPSFLDDNFAAHSQNINIQKQFFNFRYKSPQHWFEIFKTYYGPTLKTFEALEDSKAQELEKEILAILEEMNIAQDGTLVLPSEYLEIVITK